MSMPMERRARPDRGRSRRRRDRAARRAARYPTATRSSCPRTPLPAELAPRAQRCSAAPATLEARATAEIDGIRECLRALAGRPAAGAGTRPAGSSTSARNPGRPRLRLPMRSGSNGSEGQRSWVEERGARRSASRPTTCCSRRSRRTCAATSPRRERLCRQRAAPGRHRARAPTQLLGAMLSERDDTDGAIDLFEAAADRGRRPRRDNLGFYNNYANVLRTRQATPARRR